MIIHKMTSGILSVNTYFVENENLKEAVVIDCGEYYDSVIAKAESLGVDITAVLLTHAHFDHVGCAYRFMERGIPVYISDIDAFKLKTDENLGKRFRRNYHCFSADKIFTDGEELMLSDITFKVVKTAGHTDGSVCFFVEDAIFSGDTLFFESVGRTDFPTGDFAELKKSVLRLYALKGDRKVYPGHGEETTLSHERERNMFIKEND